MGCELVEGAEGVTVIFTPVGALGALGREGGLFVLSASIENEIRTTNTTSSFAPNL